MSARATILQKRGRDSLDIIFLILKTALEGELKTQIMYKVGLNYANLCSYLSTLMDLRLIEEVKRDSNTVFHTTQKGLQYIQAYGNIRQLLILTDAIEGVEKKSKRNLRKRRTPSATEEPLSTEDQLLLLVNDHEELFKIMNSRISNLERKLDTIYAELKKDKK